MLAAFVAVESRAADPMLDLSLLRKPALTAASIAAFAFGLPPAHSAPQSHTRT